MQAIKGIVTDSQGKGLKDAEVTATNGAKKSFEPARTNEKGNYEIPNLADDTYTVVAKAKKFRDSAPVNVDVKTPQDAVVPDIKLAPVSIYGRVTMEDGGAVAGVEVRATDDKGNKFEPEKTDAEGFYNFPDLSKGTYTVYVAAPEPDKYIPAHNVAVSPGVTTDGIDFSRNVVHDFLGRLDDARFSLETPISKEEAMQARNLFSVVTLMLAGLSQRRVGNEDKTDILGVLNLYYGLQDGSLRGKFTFGDDSTVWGKVEKDLKNLAEDLDRMQSDVEFLNREAKRQFNLGRSNDVLANVQFPSLFKRYMEIGTDPLLSLDLRREEASNFSDKTRLAQADDLLKELKGLILQIVRSLSKYGTAATRRVNSDWARFEAKALEVLATVAQYRVTPDQDEKNQWAVLADLTGKNRETDVAPLVVLARHGGRALEYAMKIYEEEETKNQIDNFDRDHLRDIFQPQGQTYWSTKIREEATIIKRYPFSIWT